MKVAVQAAVRATDHEERAALVVVDVGVAHRRAVDDHGLVEEAGAALLDACEPIEEVGNQPHVVPVDLGELQDVVGPAAVVRRRMEALVDTALGVDPAGGVPAHLEREDAGHVRLEGERLQVEHQLDVLVEGVGHTRGRTRQFALFAAFVAGHHAGDPPLDLADVVEVAFHSPPVDGVQLPLQGVHFGDDEVEDAGAGPPPRGTRFGGTARTEKLVECDPRIAHHRQWLIGRRPGDGVGIDARVAVGAAARLVDVFDAELHGGDRGVLPEALCIELVDRGSDPDVGTLGLLRMRLGQEGRAGAEVVAPDLLGFPGFRTLHVGVADDREVVPVRLQRTKNAGAEVEAAARLRGGPEVLRRAPGVASGRAVNHLDRNEAGAVQRRARPGDCPPFPGRDHRVQKRQRDARAEAAQEGPAGQMPSGDQMHRALPVPGPW